MIVVVMVENKEYAVEDDKIDDFVEGLNLPEGTTLKISYTTEVPMEALVLS